MGTGPWPWEQASLTGGQALFVGLLLLIAAAGKSALVPFSGWLPRAMEGPTPSSAIFYGALSVHLGAFLLLRVSPILEQSVLLSAMVVTIGLVTALYAAMTARVQTDIEERAGVRVAHAGGHHRRRNRHRAALHRADSHHRTRLPANAATAAGSHAAA